MKSIVWNYDDYPITQGFGPDGGFNPEWYGYAAQYGWPAGTHIGLDVGTPKLTPIHAAQDGVVIRAGWDDSFRPNPVWVRERDGDVAIYGHLWEENVAVGQHVAAGQRLGASGEQTYKGTMTPDGSGPHIHFELRRPIGNQSDGQGMSGYKAVDPAAELTGGTEVTFGDTLGDTKNHYHYGFDMLPSTETLKTLGFRIGLIAVGIAAAYVATKGLQG
jgi:murein DD-endopeptidase MepM/ murein hydrolase activator NlpD